MSNVTTARIRVLNPRSNTGTRLDDTNFVVDDCVGLSVICVCMVHRILIQNTYYTTTITTTTRTTANY